MIFNILTIFICLSFVLALRQYDKKDKSMEKLRKYYEKIIADFQVFFTQKKESLSEASLEIDTKQEHALASVKRLDSIIADFNKKIEAQKAGLEIIHLLEQKTIQYDKVLKDLFEMTEAVEENLMKIKAESQYVSKAQEKITNLKKQQDYLEKRIPQLEKEFAAENEASLDALTKGLLDTFHKETEQIESSTRNALVENEKILARIEQSYEDALTNAIEKADKVEGQAFDKLRNKAIERVEKSNAFLEEKTAFLNDSINSKTGEIEKLIHSFNENWRNEANEYLSTIRFELKNVQDEYKNTTEELEQSLADHKNESEILFQKINSELYEGEDALQKMRNEIQSLSGSVQEEIKNTFTSTIENTKNALGERFIALSSETESKLLEFTNEYQSLLQAFTDDFSYKSESLEKGIFQIDTIKQSLESSLKELTAHTLDEFETFKEVQVQSLEKHELGFESQLSAIGLTIQNLENELQELKQRAYDNVSSQLTVFEDTFLADLTKQSQSLNDSLENWQNDFDGKLESLALECSDDRKVLENKYTEELKDKIQAIQERFSNYTETLESSFDEQNKKYQSEISNFDERLVLFVGEYKDAFAKTRLEADSYLKAEINHFIASTEEQIKRYEKELSQSLDKMTGDVNDSSQQAAVLLDSIRTDFSEWKERMNMQFDEVKTIFEDKYSSFNEDTESVLADLKSFLDTSINQTTEKSFEHLKELEEKISMISSETQSVVEHYNKHSNDIVEDLKTMYKEMLEETERKIKDQKVEIEDQLRQEKKIVQDIKLTNETNQEKMILKMQKDSDNLNTNLDEIDRKIKQFIAQTQVFEKADVLKLDLEEKISELKTETTQLAQYEKMIRSLENQIEKLKKTEDEVNQKVLRFNQEKKKIDAMEESFNELVILSSSIDQKVEGLKTTNDDLLIMQGDVRNYQNTIHELTGKIERLEKKEPFLEQTIEGVELNFQKLEDLEKKLSFYKSETENLPEKLSSLQNDIESLMTLNPKIQNVFEKIDSLDDILTVTEERFDTMQDSKHWLANIETRLNEINKEAKSHLKLLGEVTKTSGTRDKHNSKALIIETRENVVSLARLNWTPEKIAERLNISQGEVELILNTAGE